MTVAADIIQQYLRDGKTLEYVDASVPDRVAVKAEMKVISCRVEGISGQESYCRTDERVLVVRKCEVMIEGFAQRLKLESCDLMILEVRGL